MNEDHEERSLDEEQWTQHKGDRVEVQWREKGLENPKRWLYSVREKELQFMRYLQFLLKALTRFIWNSPKGSKGVGGAEKGLVKGRGVVVLVGRYFGKG